MTDQCRHYHILQKQKKIVSYEAKRYFLKAIESYSSLCIKKGNIINWQWKCSSTCWLLQFSVDFFYHASVLNLLTYCVHCWNGLVLPFMISDGRHLNKRQNNNDDSQNPCHVTSTEVSRTANWRILEVCWFINKYKVTVLILTINIL